jgi:hypothetical protein
MYPFAGDISCHGLAALQVENPARYASTIHHFMISTFTIALDSEVGL